MLGYAETQIDALHRLIPDARAQRPDAVHRMRVAARRLRSCFRTYRPVLEAAATRPLIDELGWLAGELGADRDREVLAERLARRLAELPAELTFGPVAQRIGDHTASRSAASRERLLAALDGERLAALLADLDRLRRTPPLRPAAGRPARRVLTKAVRRERERCAARLATARTAAPGHERDHALHDARKAAKRARYAAESARPVLGKRAAAEAKRFTALQDLLGDHQDGVLARDALLALARQAEEAGEPGFSYGLLYGRETALAERCEAALPAAEDLARAADAVR